MEFSIRQDRSTLRWHYRIDGQESEKGYPTAGEAERAAMIAMQKPKVRPKRLQWALVWAMAVFPLVGFLIYLVNVYLLGR